MPLQPKVLRAGMGAHFRLPMHTMNWDEINQVKQVSKFKGFSRRYEWSIMLGDGFPSTAGVDYRGEAEEPVNRLANSQMLCEDFNGWQHRIIERSSCWFVLMFEVMRQRRN